MDFLQDLLFYSPNSLAGILVMNKLILNGNLSLEVRKLFFRGRGVPLLGPATPPVIKIRPIFVGDPFHKVSSNLLVASIRTKVIEKCGMHQLGNGISGGTEIVIGVIRTLLALHPDWILAVGDSNNAFNSVFHRSLMEAVNEHIPEASSFVHCTLLEPLEVDFCNYNEEKNLRMTMETGIAQGDPMSPLLFNICRVNPLMTLHEHHPDVFMLHYQDDDFFLRPPDLVFAATDSFDELMAPINLIRNRTKSLVYDQSGGHPNLREKCIEHGFTYVQPESGVVVLGSPVGSLQYMRQVLSEKVEFDLKGQLEKLKTIFLTPNGRMKKDVQTIYQLIRLCLPSQLTFLLRTCSPDVTQGAAHSLDLLLDQFFTLLFESRQYSQAMDENAKEIFIKRLHLQFRRGGMGITASEAIIGAAYVGSVSLTFHYWCKLIPGLAHTLQENQTRDFQLFKEHLQLGQDLCPNLRDITVESMSLRSFQKVQKDISNGVQKQMEESVDRSIAQGPTAGGRDMIFARMSEWDQEKSIQHMANKDPLNYAFLTANPCASLCAMSNAGFINAVQHRLLLRIGQGFEFCACGDDRRHGSFFGHQARCPNMLIRNPIRNNMHKELKLKFADIIKVRIQKAGMNRRVDDVEPILGDYVSPKEDPPPPYPPDNPGQNSQRQNQTKTRADMVIHLNDLNHNLLIDFTYVEPTSAYIGEYNKACQGARKGKSEKLKEYRNWNLQSNNGTNKIEIIAVETFCLGIPEDLKSVFSKFIHERENRSYVMNLVIQQLSVALHTIRAKQFEFIKGRFALQQRPAVGYLNQFNR